MNTMTTLAIISLSSLLFVAGCKGPASVNHVGAEREITQEVRRSMRPVDSLASSMLAQAQLLDVLMKENAEHAAAVNASLPAIAQRINTMYDGTAKSDMLFGLQLIRGNKALNESGLVQVRSRMDEIDRILRPENMDRVRDELVRKELEAYRERYGSKPPSKRDMRRMSDRVVHALIRQVQEATSMQLQANEELRVLQLKQNSIVFELRTLEANLQLTKDLWNLNNLSYFDTGSDRLSAQGEAELLRDLHGLLDSLSSKLATLLGEFIAEPARCTIQLKLYVDGYADSQGFASRSMNDRRSANLDLSQRRANVVFDHLKRAIDDRMSNVHWHGFNVEPALTAALGHGEEFPWSANDWRPDGLPDADRRVAKVCVTFTILPLTSAR